MPSSIGIPSAPHVPMPPVKPSKDRTPEPSCLARGIAKAWIEDRDKWAVERTCLKDAGGDQHAYSYWRVRLYHPLGICITLKEPHSDPIIDDMDVEINGHLKIWELNRHSIRIPQMTRDYCHLREAIYQRPYPELAVRREQAVQADATRAQNIKAIETLGCSAQGEQAHG